MKLVEIKDVRVGQIWKNKYGDTLLVKNVSILHNENIDVIQWNKDINSVSWMGKYKRDLIIKQRTSKEYITKSDCNWKLIGFIGITHKIKGNKIVEIPREDFETDDIFQAIVYTKSSLDPTFDIGCDFKEVVGVIRFAEDESGIVFDYDGNEYKKDELEKIGIFGITHEFINERLVK